MSSDLMLYACSLYCEGNGLTKSYAFTTMRNSETNARAAAILNLQNKFPESEGWGNYFVSIIEIPKEMILGLAAGYKEK